MSDPRQDIESLSRAYSPESLAESMRAVPAWARGKVRWDLWDGRRVGWAEAQRIVGDGGANGTAVLSG